jgi:hypothetical protein
MHNIFRLAIERILADFQNRSCVGMTMDTVETAIFWLEVFWTPGLVLTGYLLLPRPGDLLDQLERGPRDERQPPNRGHCDSSKVDHAHEPIS